MLGVGVRHKAARRNTMTRALGCYLPSGHMATRDTQQGW